VPALVRLIDVLEENGDLDRKTEGLAPSDDYARRAAAGTGLSRPELAVLLSSAKLVLQRALEESPVVDDPVLEEELLAAFPQAMRERFETEIVHHRLRGGLQCTTTLVGCDCKKGRTLHLVLRLRGGSA
jgi:glutamate dehydrogenase